MSFNSKKRVSLFGKNNKFTEILIGGTIIRGILFILLVVIKQNYCGQHHNGQTQYDIKTTAFTAVAGQTKQGHSP
jgi:hypothetical protein